MSRSLALLTLVLAVAAFGVACTSNAVTSPTVTLIPTSATVSKVTVSGTAPTVGNASQFSAIATLSDGSTVDVTSLATWRTSDSNAANVTATGIVGAVSAGTVTVTASYQNVSGSDQITIGQ